MQNMEMLQRSLEYIEQYIGKILVCKLINGQVFSARLVAVMPNGILLFKNSHDELISDRLEDIIELNEYSKRKSTATTVPKSTSIAEVF